MMMYYNNNMGAGAMRKDELSIDDSKNIGEEEKPIVPIFNVNDNFLRTEYEIKTRYSIAGDNKAHNVIINNFAFFSSKCSSGNIQVIYFIFS